MIYTVTLNPSLDYVVKVKDFQCGIINRTSEEIIYPGGKGINVSIVLKNLGYESVSLGFVAGFTGEELCLKLKEKGITTHFITSKMGLTRINVKIHSYIESEINGIGPCIDEMELNDLFTRLDKLKEGDILILAGSIPEALPTTIYQSIMKSLDNKKIKIIVDATKDSLWNVLQYKPFLIKPNHHELSELFGKELNNIEEILHYARKLHEMGAQNVLVSMAADGAVLVTDKGHSYYSGAPIGVVKNSVGAGDSMVAGFIAGYLKNNNYKEAFQMGICAGSASAFSDDLATEEDVNQIVVSHKFEIKEFNRNES